MVAIHVLSYLALRAGRGPVCSNEIAKSVHTNPVVVRRLMSALERRELVLSTAGRSGGFMLARDANTISLADIYGAVEEKAVFRMHHPDPASECPVACRLANAIAPSLKAAELALTASLGVTTLKSIASAIAAP